MFLALPRSPRFCVRSLICLIAFGGGVSTACTTPRSGSIDATYDASMTETFAAVRGAFDRMGYTITKEDVVAGEIQAASAPPLASPALWWLDPLMRD